MSNINNIIFYKDITDLIYYLYSNNNYKNNEKSLFYKILNKFFIKKNLFKIILNNININDINDKLKKKDLINIIYNDIYNKYINKIIIIQKLFKRQLIYKIEKLNYQKSENVIDPFSFDNIDDISNDIKYSYRNDDGHIYSFNASDFEYFLINNKNENGSSWNPYTRENIPLYIIKNLQFYMKYKNIKSKLDTKYIWNTPLHAYTDVSLYIDKIGFFTNVKWFISFNLSKVLSIIDFYQSISKDIEDNIYFKNDFKSSLNNDNFIFEFSKETIKLFENGNDHYLLCCNYMKSLAYNSYEIYKSLPTWLFNHDVPIIILNDYRLNITREYEFDFENFILSRIIY